LKAGSETPNWVLPHGLYTKTVVMATRTRMVASAIIRTRRF
jgi:hypothetical protein